MSKWRDCINSSEGAVMASFAEFGQLNVAVQRVIRTNKETAWVAEISLNRKTLPLASPDLQQAKVQAKALLQVMLENALKELLEET